MIRYVQSKAHDPRTGVQSLFLRAKKELPRQFVPYLFTRGEFVPSGSFSKKSVVAVVTLVILASVLLYAATGAITSFTVPGATYVDTVGINASGMIAGNWIDRQNVRHAYLLNSSTGALTIVDEPLAGTESNDGTFIFGINDLGQTAGAYTVANSSGVIEPHGFLRDPYGNYTSFDDPGEVQTSATAINNSGVIAGDYSPNQGGNVDGFIRDVSGNITNFAVPDSRYTFTFAINSSSEITGYYTDSTGASDHGFIRFPSGSLITFNVPNAVNTYPAAINNSGMVAGYHVDSSDSNSVRHAFYRDSLGNFTSFDAPGAGTGEAQGTYAMGINAAGDITGYFLDSNSIAHGYVRNQSGSFLVFDDSNAGIQSGQGTFACCINRMGQVAGDFLSTQGKLRGFFRK